MKGLSLTQPWATLVAVRAKRIETRSWGTKYSGPVAIHASKGMPQEERDLCYTPPFRQILTAAGYLEWADLPRSAIIAVAEILDCQRITEESVPPWPEQDFGDYTPGRYAWHLVNVQSLPEPIPCKGALGLWTLPPEIEARIMQIIG